MKRTVFLIVTILLNQYLYGQVPANREQLSRQKADSLLARLVDIDRNVGVVAGIAIDGQTKWVGKTGYLDQENGIEVNQQMKTRIASIAKSMTAVGIFQLHEKGLVELDVPIQKYIPDFPTKKKGEITVRHLLNHTSGLPGYKNSREQQNTQNYASLQAAVDLFKDRALISQPGTSHQYTTYGYVVLGLIIEKVSGMTYEAYMQENIWDKAGMKDTGVEKYGKEYPNKSKLYHKNSKGKVKRGVVTNLSDRIPGGGFYSTVPDLLRFGKAVMNFELISEASTQEMFKDPKVENDGNPYGAGWFLYGNNPTYGEVYGHSGGQAGASTQLMLLPQEKITIVVLSNTSRTWKDIVNCSVQLFEVAANLK